MKKHLSTIVLVAVFLVGVCLLLYPTVSDYWNSLHQTWAIGAYEETLTDMTEKDYSAYFDQADAYNEALAALSFPLADYKQLTERADLTAYAELLDVGGTGVMGYIDIDAIGVELPIYHTTARTQRCLMWPWGIWRAAACRWAAQGRIACFRRIAACPARGCLPIWTSSSWATRSKSPCSTGS